MNTPQTCLICKKTSRLREFMKYGKYAYLFCNKCRGAFLTPRPTVSQLKGKIYTPSYFMEGRVGSIQKAIFSLRLYKSYEAWVTSFFPKPSKILDVGAGSGEFISEMRKLGWEVYAQELSAAQAKKIASKIGKDSVYPGDFQKAKIPMKFFDAVCFWHVLEHLPDPFVALQKTNKLLKKGGRVFIEVPNLNSATLKVFGKYYDFLRIPEHLSYFSVTSLRKIFKKAGFKIQKIEYPLKYNSTFSLSVRNLVAHLLGKNISWIFFYLSLPLSLLWTILMVRLKKSEVIRVVAIKD